MTPRCIYFYYIRPTADGNYAMFHYYYAFKHNKIPLGELRSKVIKLTANARKEEVNQAPPPCGQNFEFIVWSRKSYIVFVIDKPCVEFHATDPFKMGDGSYCFTDFATFSIPAANNMADVSVAYCVNRMKAAHGEDLDEAADYFTIKLNTNPPISIVSEARPRPDDGGTNMGPPVPPP